MEFRFILAVIRFSKENHMYCQLMPAMAFSFFENKRSLGINNKIVNSPTVINS